MENFQSFFPFKEIRACQQDIITKIFDNFEEFENIVIEAPTGIGKSAIAIAICRYFEKDKAYVLTTQKLLQQQYINDFGQFGLKEIKSKENYQCKRDNCNCLEGLGIAKAIAKAENYKGNSGKFFGCLKDCTYMGNKKEFLEANISITNYSFFLNAVKYTPDIEERMIMICDECHSIEKNIMDFVEIDFSLGFMENVLKIDPQIVPRDEKSFALFLKSNYKNRLMALLTELNQKLLDCTNNDGIPISKLATKYDRHLCKINRFLESYDEDEKNWVYEVLEDKNETVKFTFKPLFINSFAHDVLFNKAKKRIFFSATVISKKNFCHCLGLDEEDTYFVSVGSPFEIKNRLIRYQPVDKMNFGNIDIAIPKVCRAADEIIAKYPDQKGIIHTNNYKVAKYFKENSKYAKRLLDHTTENRMDILEKHIASKKPTILLSPSMAEGVDLKDDSSRFQIVCKIPFPYLGDKRISMRKDIDMAWYFTESIKILCQSVGRSIRNENDYADTFILDESFEQLFRKNKALFPKWFREALIFDF